MERLKKMKDNLIEQVEGQMSDLRCVNTHELGEVIDMIKDLEESMYYHSITKAMEESAEDKEKQMYYIEKYLPPYEEYYRDSDRADGRMYYTPKDRTSPTKIPERETWEPKMTERGGYNYPVIMRDMREGRSPMSRKTYMESKEMHQDKNVQMKELENYMSELSQDITEMIQMASPEEKAILQKKLAALSSKIV